MFVSQNANAWVKSLLNLFWTLSFMDIHHCINPHMTIWHEIHLGAENANLVKAGKVESGHKVGRYSLPFIGELASLPITRE